MQLQLPEEVTEVLERLDICGYRSFLIGGVRDLLIGKTPNDWDVATSARPDKIKEVFQDENLVLTGEKFGTVTVIIGNVSIDITTFRKEATYSDNRHPDKVEFTSNLFEDLKRRDFTINAIAYSPKEGFCDYFCGHRDIRKRIIRAIGDPAKRFEEDALRILRALRFSSVLGFEIEEKTKIAIHENRELIKTVSEERIQKEFTKLLLGQNVLEVLLEFPDVIGVFIPEVLKTVGFSQKSPFHKYDVWGHTCHAVHYSPEIAVIRCALFFHDLSKPDCFSEDRTGRGHFYSHPKKSAFLAGEILTRLKYPTKFITNVTELILYHDSHPKTDAEIKKILSAVGVLRFWQLTSVIEADILAHATWTVKPRLKLLEELRQNARRIISSGECWRKEDLAVNGNDVAALGLTGEKIGLALSLSFDAVLKGTVPNTKEEILAFISKKEL